MTARPRGPAPGWHPSRPRPAGILADLIARYSQHEREGTLPRGGRGIFYDLRPDGMGNGVTYRKPDSAHPVTGFGPMEAHPAAVQEVLVMARRAGIIPESWVADTRAPTPHARYYDESADLEAARIARQVGAAARLFALDPQLHQPQYVELWCEAEDLSPRLARIAEPYGVPVYSGGGYDGLKGKRRAAERAVDRDVPTAVLHVGDRDDHGDQIFTAVSEDALAWADGNGRPDGWLTFRRLALTRDQAEQYGLLDADGKAEADALPVAVLDAIVADALDELFTSAGPGADAGRRGRAAEPAARCDPRGSARRARRRAVNSLQPATCAAQGCRRPLTGRRRRFCSDLCRIRGQRAERVTETGEFGRAAIRMIRTMAKRVGASDLAEFGAMWEVRAEAERAAADAIDGLRASGFSWAEIAAEIGVSKQAVHQWHKRRDSAADVNEQLTPDEAAADE